MARGKLCLKLIENEKIRASTFKKRLKGLKKKAYEFSILCDVQVCMIIFEPKLKDSPAKVEVWPSDPDQVNNVIGKYKSTVAAGAQKKIFDIYDFFSIRKRQVHDEVAQVRKANFKAKFPTWDDRIDSFSPEHIASFLAKLDLSLEVVKRKIFLMKGDHDQYNLNQFCKPKPVFPDYNIPGAAAFRPRNLNYSDNHFQAHGPQEILNQFDHIPAFSQKNLEFGVTREQRPIPVKPLDMQLPSLSPADETFVKLSLSLNPLNKPMNPLNKPMNPIDKSLRMSMMNNIDFRVQPGFASSCSSSIPNNLMYNHPPSVSPIHHDPRFGMAFNPPSIPVLHDPIRSTAMQNNAMFKEPNSAPFHQNCFYSPPMQPELASYNRQQMMTEPAFPQMHHSQFPNSYQDMDEYEMNNEKQRF